MFVVLSLNVRRESSEKFWPHRGSGSNSLELELQGALSEVKKGWQPAEIDCFKELIATCIAKRDGTLESIGKGPKITAGQLEKQSFDLLLSSLQHDVDSYTVWKAKCSDRESALYFQRLNYQSQRHSRARDMAQAVFSEDKGLGWHMSLLQYEAHDSTNMASWVDLCNHIARQCQLQSAEQVQSVCVLNWAAPAVFSSSCQSKQAKLLGAIVNSHWLGSYPQFFLQEGSIVQNNRELQQIAGRC